MTVVMADSHYASLCKMDGERCTNTPVPRHLLQKIDLPANACAIRKCTNCITAMETYVVTPNFELIAAKTFVLRNEELEPSQNIHDTSFYSCATAQDRQCNCITHACTGPKDFCAIYNCSQPAQCSCYLTYEKATLIFMGEDRTIENPTLLNIQVCIHQKKIFQSRKLQEAEQAIFTRNNLTLTFIDPILTLPDSSGRLILRTDDYETLITVKDSKQVTIPFELLAHKTLLTAIFIADNGLSVDAEIHIEGKKICRITGCIFCRENFNTYRCWKPFFRNLLWGFTLFIIMMGLIMIKIIIKTVTWTILAVIHQIILLLKLIKMTARLFLLLGSYAGNTARQGIKGLFEALEERNQEYKTSGTIALALLALCLMVEGTQASCSDYNIIKSNLKMCEHTDALEESCKMTISVEVTLKNINHDTCLWFHSKEGKPLFTLTLKLEEVQCHFSTERLYFTFPVETRSQSQITCSQNKFCSWGQHCAVYSYNGLNFEAETREARSYTGYSTCEPSNRGNGCIISHTPACAFKRIYFVPELDKSFEVSKITGHTCAYKIAIEHSINGTVHRTTLKDKTITIKGIRIKLLGAFDQSTMVLTEKLITRVGNPAEGYLAEASEKNNPIANIVGAIQANQSHTKNFLFAKDITSCEFFEDNLRCIENAQAIKTMMETQEGRLPSTRGLHSLHMHKGHLRSKLLSSSAIKLQLAFANYQISIQRSTVCPVIEGNNLEITGCYKCGILAELTLTAKSSCKPGLVTVTFEGIQVHTKAVQLNTEPSTIVVKLLAETKCFEDKICLQSSTNIQCRQISFCLDEPSIELLKLQGGHFEQTASSTSGSIFQWVHFPRLDSAFFFIKFAGAALLCIGLLITIVSTVITCCCSRK